MSDPWRPIDGEEIVTTAAVPAAADDLHSAEAAGAPAPDAADGGEDDEPAPSRLRRDRRPLDTRLLLLSAIFVAVLAQLVVGFLALNSINDLRNQTASANGLQHCLITAQLKQVSSTNAAAYQSDVRACVSK